MIHRRETATMRVLFFECGEFGGSVRCLGNMLKGLSALGCEVGFVSQYRRTGPVDLDSLDCVQEKYCLDLPPHVRPRPNVVVRTFGVLRPTRFAFRYFRVAMHALRRFRPDVAYLNNGPGAHLPALMAARMLRIPAVCHLRGIFDLRPLDRVCLSRIQRFVVLTKWGRQSFHNQGIPFGGMHQMYDPFDVAEFDRQSRERMDVPAGDNGAVYAVQVGRLREHKRPDLAVEAFALARKECPKLELILAGNGPMQDELEKLIARRGLGDSVHLIGHCSQIPALLGRCHIGLMTSRSEGLGLCFLEYMAAQLPVVTWAMPVTPEVVAADAGIVLETATPEAFASAFIKLYRSAKLRREMGQAGRQSLADGRFEPMRYARELRDMLTDVVAGQPYKEPNEHNRT